MSTTMKATDVAATIPAIVENMIGRIEFSGHDYRWTRESVAVLRSLQYRVTGPRAIDVCVTPRYGSIMADVASGVLDELEIGMDKDGLPIGHIAVIGQGHFRLTW